MGIERRKFERYAVNLPGVVADAEAEVRVLNISLRGALILTDAKFGLWETLELSVFFEAAACRTFMADVMWAEGGVTGVEFVGVTEEDVKFLQDYMSGFTSEKVSVLCAQQA